MKAQKKRKKEPQSSGESEGKAKRFDPITVDANLWQCLSTMRQARVEALPVCEGENLVGLVSEEDILKALRVGAESGARSLVKDVMKTRVFCCYEDEDPKRVMENMEVNSVRHALILNRLGTLIGMITVGSRPVSETGASLLC